MSNITRDRKIRRKRRVSANIIGNAERPRVSVYRSQKYIYAQVINDDNHNVVAAYSSLQLEKADKKKQGTKSEVAKQVGIKLAALLKEKKVTAVVFDRGVYSYNGRVKSLAEGLREGEIKV